jgi:hypothetical protein
MVSPTADADKDPLALGWARSGAMALTGPADGPPRAAPAAEAPSLPVAPPRARRAAGRARPLGADAQRVLGAGDPRRLRPRAPIARTVRLR